MLKLPFAKNKVTSVMQVFCLALTVAGVSACSKQSTIEGPQHKSQKRDSVNAISLLKTKEEQKAEDKKNDPNSRFIVFTNKSSGAHFYKFDDIEKEHNEAESFCLEKGLKLPDSFELESLVKTLESNSSLRKEWLAGKLKSTIWAENGNQTAGWYLRVSVIKKLTKYDYSARAGKLETRCVNVN